MHSIIYGFKIAMLNCHHFKHFETVMYALITASILSKIENRIIAFTIAFLHSKSVILHSKTMFHFFKLPSYILKIKTELLNWLSNSKTAFSILNLRQFNSKTYFFYFNIVFLDFISHSITAFWIWKFPCCIFRSV